MSPHVCGRAEASRVRTPFSTKYCHQGGEDDGDNGDGDGDGDVKMMLKSPIVVMKSK